MTTASLPQPAPITQLHPALAEDVILGVDTHKDIHVAAVITTLGASLAHQEFPTTAVGCLPRQGVDHLRGGPLPGDDGVLGLGGGHGRVGRALGVVDGADAVVLDGGATTRPATSLNFPVNRPGRACFSTWSLITSTTTASNVPGCPAHAVARRRPARAPCSMPSSIRSRCHGADTTRRQLPSSAR